MVEQVFEVGNSKKLHFEKRGPRILKLEFHVGFLHVFQDKVCSSEIGSIPQLDDPEASLLSLDS